MGGHISLNVVNNSVSVKEGVKNVNKVFWLLEIILHSYEMVDTSPGVFQYSIQVS